MSSDELPLSDEITSADVAQEMVRLWITDNNSTVLLHYGGLGEDEVRIWGMLVADIAAHVLKAAVLDGTETSRRAALRSFEAGFRERLAHNPTMKGRFEGRQLQ